MLETADEVEALQQLLDASHAASTQYLRSIVDDQHVLDAGELVTLLTGMKVLSLATVTARGEPRISAVDGHFLHGTWSFGTSATAAKARHLQARPAVSVAHIDGERLGVFSHGHAEAMRPGDADWDETLGHWTAYYGSSPLTWADEVRLYRYRPTWMVGYAADRDALLARTDTLLGPDVRVRRATRADVPALVALLADDPLGAGRETPDGDMSAYHRAFAAIDADPNQLLVAATDGDRVVATLQLTFVPGLSRGGALRAQIEAVRVHADHRGRGLGEALFGWAVDEARRRGCVLVQLTTDKSRGDAHRFYERLGFVASHEGYKLTL